MYFFNKKITKRRINKTVFMFFKFFTTLFLISILFDSYFEIIVPFCPSFDFNRFYYYEQQEQINQTMELTTTGNVTFRGTVDCEEFSTWIYVDDTENRIVKEPLILLSGNRCPEAVRTSCIPAYRERNDFFHIKNVFVKDKFDIILPDGNFLFLPMNPFQPKLKDKIYNVKSKITYKYVVFIPMFIWYSFGHWMNDGLPTLISMPQWVWSLNPVIICPADYGLVQEHINAVGLGHLQLLGSPNYYIYAEHLFVAKAFEGWNGYGLHAYPKLKEIFFKYYNLSTIKPENYYYINKKKGEWRYFENMDLLMETAKNVTHLPWTKFENHCKERERWARTFASIKIIVIPCGSIAFNGVFMHDGTGMLTLMANKIDFPQLRFTYFAKIWTIGVMHMSIHHYGGAGKADIERCIKALLLVIYAVDHQRYGTNDLFMPMDVKESEEMFLKYGDQWSSLTDYWLNVKNMVKLYLAKEKFFYGHP